MAASLRHPRGRHPDRHRITAWSSPVTIRLAAVDEAAALGRLAALDSRPLPPGPHLVAERGGRIEAALSLSSHEVVADPFRRTAELCELLRCHAGGMQAAPQRSQAALPCPRPRLVPA